MNGNLEINHINLNQEYKSNHDNNRFNFNQQINGVPNVNVSGSMKGYIINCQGTLRVNGTAIINQNFLQTPVSVNGNNNYQLFDLLHLNVTKMKVNGNVYIEIRYYRRQNRRNNNSKNNSIDKDINVQIRHHHQ